MSKNKIYPFAVASVRSMENKLLSQQKLMQMAEAKSAEEALRLLSDTAYGKTQVQDVHQFEEMIETHLEETYTSVAKLIPDEALIDIFLYKNDYHNIKVLSKEEILRANYKRFLVRGGTIPLFGTAAPQIWFKTCIYKSFFNLCDFARSIKSEANERLPQYH